MPDHVEPGSAGRALVTGVGRRVGIGSAIADRLRADGFDVATAGWRGYDQRMPWGADGDHLALHDVDFGDPFAPTRLVAEVAESGPLTALVMCHCESVDSDIRTTTVESFDRHFAVNARSVWLLIQAFSEQFQPTTANGRIVAITSDHTAYNLPYGASKGALDRIVIAAATELADLGVTANVINPGANETGWMTDEVRSAVLARNLQRRIGTPADTADLVSFLVSAAGGWINGQLLYSDGGLRP